MNKYQQHQNLLKKSTLELQSEFPNLRIFARHVGLFYTQNGTPIKINTKGMFDLWGLLKTSSGTYHIEFEVKSGSARKSKPQILWGQFLDSMGVKHFLITDDNLGEIKKNLHAISNEQVINKNLKGPLL